MKISDCEVDYVLKQEAIIKGFSIYSPSTMFFLHIIDPHIEFLQKMKKCRHIM